MVTSFSTKSENIKERNIKEFFDEQDKTYFAKDKIKKCNIISVSRSSKFDRDKTCKDKEYNELWDLIDSQEKEIERLRKLTEYMMGLKVENGILEERLDLINQILEEVDVHSGFSYVKYLILKELSDSKKNY